MSAFHFRNYRLLHKLVICFAAIITAAMASSAWIYHQRERLADADLWTEHSYHVLDELNEAMEGALSQENGLRGYLISNNPVPLENYRIGQRDFSAHMAKLRQLTSENSAQQKGIDDIENSIGRWSESVAVPALKLMSDATTRDRAVSIGREATDKQTFAAVRNKGREIESVERGVLADREKVKIEAREQIGVAIIAAGIAMALLAAAAVILLAGSIAAPLARMTEAVGRLTAGKLDTEIATLDRDDEIGKLSGALVAFKTSLTEAANLRDAQEQQERRTAQERRADMNKLADTFEKTVGNIVTAVSSASTELETAAGTLTRTADTTQQLAGQVASASEEASSNVRSVATAAEEMATAVNEISRQAQDSRKIAQQAVNQAERTDTRMNELAQAAARIGDVVKLIAAIAEQTNLLALNATIEAARAGKSGKGFAVVAAEVKTLAAQTAKATGEIGAQIGGMQAATQDSVGAIKEIGTTISSLSQIAAAIALAVEEQDAVTREIGRNVQQAASGTTQVASTISDVSRGATETGSASNQVFASAQALADEGSKLKLEVDNFLNSVRAA